MPDVTPMSLSESESSAPPVNPSASSPSSPPAEDKSPRQVLREGRTYGEGETVSEPPPVDLLEKFGLHDLIPEDQREVETPAPAVEAPAPPVDPDALSLDVEDHPAEDPRIAALQEEVALLRSLVSPPQQQQTRQQERPSTQPSHEQIVAEMRAITLPGGKTLDAANAADVLAYLTYRDSRIANEALQKQVADLTKANQQTQRAAALQQAATQVRPILTKALAPVAEHLPPGTKAAMERQVAAWVAEGYDPIESAKAAFKHWQSDIQWARERAKATPTAAAKPAAASAQTPPKDPKTGKFVKPSVTDRVMATHGAQPGKPSLDEASPQEMLKIIKFQAGRK